MTDLKLRSRVVLILALLGMTLVARSTVAQSYQCAGSTDGAAYSLQTYLVEIVTGTDTASASDRAQYHVPRTTASKVSYETDPNTCGTAAQSYSRALGMAVPTSGSLVVTVVRVSNSRYVVEIEGVYAGEFVVTVIFDKKWRPLATILG